MARGPCPCTVHRDSASVPMYVSASPVSDSVRFSLLYVVRCSQGFKLLACVKAQRSRLSRPSTEAVSAVCACMCGVHGGVLA